MPISRENDDAFRVIPKGFSLAAIQALGRDRDKRPCPNKLFL
jgi:hypothetical protein